MKNRLEEAQNLKRVFRRKNSFTPETSYADKLLDFFTEQLDFDNEEATKYKPGIETIDYDVRLFEAAEGYVEDLERQSQEEGKLSQTPEQRQVYLEKANEEGWSSSPIFRVDIYDPANEGDELLILPDQVRGLLMNSIPSPFLHNIDNIQAQLPFPGDDEEAPTVGVNLLLYNEAEDRYYSIIAVRWPIYIHKDAPPEEKDKARGRIAGTLKHEAAHSVHAFLTYDEMKDWVSVLESEPEPVTLYADKSKEEDPNKGVTEDFADSLSLYADRPGLLKAIYPERFNYMRGLFASYVKEDFREAYLAQIDKITAETLAYYEKQGWSSEYIRQAWQLEQVMRGKIYKQD